MATEHSMNESLRQRTKRRFLAACCALLSLSAPYAASALPFGNGDFYSDDITDGTGWVMDVGTFYGYVSTRGRVVEDNGWVWAEYLPGHEIVQERCGELPAESDPGYLAASRCFNGPRQLMTEGLREQVRLNPKKWLVAYLTGAVSKIGPATGAYENARVMGAPQARIYLKAYEEALAGHCDGQCQIQGPIDESAKIELGIPGTDATHVMLKGAGDTQEIVMLLPFDPRTAAAGRLRSDITAEGSEPIQTILVSYQEGSAGRVLAESTGTIAYLTDYYVPYEEGDPKYSKFGRPCPSRKLTVGTDFGVEAGANLAGNFEDCDPLKMKQVLGPVAGAGVSVVGFNPEVLSNNWVTTNADGSFRIDYTYPRNYLSVHPAYLRVPMSPFDFDRNAGVFLDRQTIRYGTDDYELDPSKPLNFAIDTVYLAARARFVNDVPNFSSAPVQANYDVFVGHPGSGTHDKTVYEDSPPPLSDVGSYRAGGVQRYHSLMPDLEHRGLLKQIFQGDLLNTDTYVYISDAAGNPLQSAKSTFYEKKALYSNELYGLKTQPNSGSLIFDPPKDTADGQFFARFEPRTFLSHPSGYGYKLYLINRVTGYMGSAVLGFVGAETTPNQAPQGSVTMAPIVPTESGMAYAVAGAHQGGAEMSIRPPNIRVQAKRMSQQALRAERAFAEPASSVDDKSRDGQIVGFEGAALTTDQAIKITIEWYDHDGSPMPESLPGFSARLTRVVGDSKSGETPTLEAATANKTDATGETVVSHFNIKPGTHTEVVLLPQDNEAEQYYLHVYAVEVERCDQTPPQLLQYQSAACKNFAPDDSMRSDGALKYRPANYVPIQVPIYDELATRAALDLAKQQLEAGEKVVPTVDPVYQYLYRPEMHFTLYDLEVEEEDVEVVTMWDQDEARAKSSLDFAYTLTAPTASALPGWGPDERELLFSVGYGEYLALATGDREGLRCNDPNLAEGCELSDLDRLVALQPSAQLPYVEDIAQHNLTSADYLSLQLYSATDAGNVLYDLNLGYPVADANVQPLLLKRRELHAEIDAPKVIDDYQGLRIRLSEAALVEGILWYQGEEISERLFEGFMDPGDYGFVVDYEMIAAHIGSPTGPATQEAADGNFALEMRIKPATLSCVEGQAADDNGYCVSHRLVYPGRLEIEEVGDPVGQTVVHDVRLTDGSLTLNRQDFSFPGAGPHLEFVRSYSNLNKDSDGVLGPGWSHNLDYRLQVTSVDSIDLDSTPADPGLVPAWVDAAKDGPGKFQLKPWNEMKVHIIPTNEAIPQTIQVNGTQFTLQDGSDGSQFAHWKPEKGRFAQLRLLPPSPECGQFDAPDEEEDPAGCFEFVSRDGTSYFYPEPKLEQEEAEEQESDPASFSVSLESNLAYRAGYMDLATGPRPEASVWEHKAFKSTSVQLIRDRHDQELRFYYYPEQDKQLGGRLQRVVDKGAGEAGDRSCVLGYSSAGVAGSLCDAPYQGNKVRLVAVDCLGGPPSGTHVEFCYRGDGHLIKAAQGTDFFEKYDYEPQSAGSGEGCSPDSDPKKYPWLDSPAFEGGTTNSGTGGGEAGTGGAPGTGGAGSVRDGHGHVHNTAEVVGSLSDADQWSKAGYPTASGGASSDAEPEAEAEAEICPMNLVSTENEFGGITKYAYSSGEVNLGFRAFEERPSADVVRSVTYPDANGLDDGTELFFNYEDTNREVATLLDETNSYVLDARGHPTTITEPNRLGASRTTTQQWSEGLLDVSTVSISGSGAGLAAVTTEYDYELGDVTVETLHGDDLEVTTTHGWENRTLPGGQRFRVLVSREVRRQSSGGTVTNLEGWVYDTFGRLQSHTDSAGKEWTYTPDAIFTGNVGTATSPEERTIAYTYDLYGNVESTTTGGTATTFTYRDARGLVTQHVDANQVETIYQFDPQGRLERVTLPTSSPDAALLPVGGEPNTLNVLEYDYIGEFKTSEQDRNGVTLTYQPTPRGLVKSVTRLGTTRNLTYDAAGNLTVEQDWAGISTVSAYDALSQKMSVTNRVGDVMELRDYDVLGNPWRTINLDEVETVTHFDALSRPIFSQVQQCSRVEECPPTTITYDLPPSASGASHADEVMVGSRSNTRTDYDGLGRALQVKSTIDGVEAITTHIYDDDGNLTDTTDPEGLTVSHLYDQHNFKTATLNRGTDGGGGILTSFDHDAMGHVIAESEFPLDTSESRSLVQEMGGSVTSYTYDVWYRLRAVTAPPAPADDLGSGVDPTGQPQSMTYDGLGNLLSKSNHRGHTERWTRNALGWVESYQDAAGSDVGRAGSCGATLCYEDFDNNGNPRRVTDARGGQSVYVYDLEERVTSVTEPEGRTWTVSDYDGLGRPVSTTQYGVQHGYDYNENGALSSDTVPSAGFSVTYQYDALGRLAQSSKSRNGRTYTTATSYAAGVEGLKATTTVDGAPEQEVQMDRAGNVVKSRDRTGVTEARILDAFYRVERVTRSNGGQNELVSTFKYYAGGMVRESTDADTNDVTSYAYDARGRLIETTLPSASNAPAAVERHAYDADGNVVATSLPTGGPGDAPYVVRMTYDGANQLRSRSAAGETTSYDYDVLGNLVEQRLPKSQGGGPVKTLQYDLAGRVTEINDRGLVTRYPLYDQRGNIKRQEIPGSNGQSVVTTFEYDDLDLVTERTERNVTGGSVTTEFEEYDPNGNFRSLKDANGKTITYQYDAVGRRRSASYPTGSPTSHIAWDYDDAARQLTITETKATGSESTVVHSHPVWDAPETVTRAQGASTVEVEYGYYADGSLEEVTSPEGTSGYTYNARNQLATVAVDGSSTSYTYFADGRPDAISYANGTTTTHRYEATRRVDSIETTGASYPIRYEYDYDSNGNRSLQIETRDIDVHATAYGYDDQDRLERTEFVSSGAPYPVVTVYGFEGLNRTTEKVTVDGTELSDKVYTYTSGNHLRQVQENGNPAVAVQPYVATYDYDDNGNLIEKSKDTGGDLEVTNYAFDVRDHLRSVGFQVGAAPPTEGGTFDYDHAGMRVHATTPDRGDVDYFYDGDRVVEERDHSSGDALARYHYGLSTVAVSDLAGGGATRKYFHHDGLGTTSHLTDDNASIRADYMVDPWGQPRDSARYQGGFVHSPTAAALNPSDPESDRNRKLFTGHEYDKSSGLIYAKARYYDPDAGRFLSRDGYLGDPGSPMSLHRYNYAHSNPGKFVDPDGNSATLVGTALGASWGVGQAIGGLIIDKLEGRDARWGNALGVVVQNTVAGAELGASVDLALVPGVSGALGGAGFSALTAGGEAASAGEFAEGQVVGALTGAASDLALRGGLAAVGAVGAMVAKTPVGQALVQAGAEGLKKVGGTALAQGAKNMVTAAGESGVVQGARKFAQNSVSKVRQATEPLNKFESQLLDKVRPRGPPAPTGAISAEAREAARPLVFQKPTIQNGADDWAGSVGAARARPTTLMPSRRPALTNLGNESGAPAVRSFQQATKTQPTRLPQNGRWTGNPGESSFIPNRASKLPHPDDPTVVDIMPGEGIPFRGGRPDFGRYAVDTFEAPGLTGGAQDRTLMAKALAERYQLPGARGKPTAAAGLEYMERIGVVPHHAGGNTVQLIPHGIHGSAAGRIGVPHVGGASGRRIQLGITRK